MFIFIYMFFINRLCALSPSSSLSQALSYKDNRDERREKVSPPLLSHSLSYEGDDSWLTNADSGDEDQSLDRSLVESFIGELETIRSSSSYSSSAESIGSGSSGSFYRSENGNKGVKVLGVTGISGERKINSARVEYEVGEHLKGDPKAKTYGVFSEKVMKVVDGDSDEITHLEIYQDYGGIDLRSIIKKLVDTASLEERFQFFVTIIPLLYQSLLFFHQKGIVHHDVATRNIVISESNGQIRLRLIDWGQAMFTEGGIDQRLFLKDLEEGIFDIFYRLFMSDSEAYKSRVYTFVNHFLEESFSEEDYAKKNE